MRVLISGGAGCLGANLSESFLVAGHDVLVVDNFTTGHRASLPPSHPHLTVVEASIADRKLIDRVFGDFRPSHVIHSAASYKNPDDWVEDTRTNVEGTIHMIRAARAAEVSRFVYFHTALCYGRSTTIPIPIDAPARPFTSYGISKQAGESYLAGSGLPFVSLRLANVTGPRLAIGPIPTFYSRLKTGRSCFCSKAVRDFIDMDDFSALVHRVLELGAPTGIFNVSTGTGHAIHEIYKIVADHIGIEQKEPIPEVDVGEDDVPVVVLDPSKTIAAFGWSPRYTFREAVQRTLSWYDVHGVGAIHSHLRHTSPEDEGRRR